MRFSTIFLVGAALAQNKVTVTRQDGSNNEVDAVPGACRGLGGSPIKDVKVPAGLVALFFDEEGCKGRQSAFAIREYFNPYGDVSQIKSVKVVNERGPTPDNNAAFYHPKYPKIGQYLYSNTPDYQNKGKNSWSNGPSYSNNDKYPSAETGTDYYQNGIGRNDKFLYSEADYGYYHPKNRPSNQGNSGQSPDYYQQGINKYGSDHMANMDFDYYHPRNRQLRLQPRSNYNSDY